jgi:hypothetical protein
VDMLITVKVGGFAGAAKASVLADELTNLLADLGRLDSELAGEVTFRAIEGQVDFVLQATSTGGLNLDGHVYDRAGDGNCLCFTLDLDQTYLPPAIRALGAFAQAAV